MRLVQGVMVDEEDYEKVSRYKWQFTTNGHTWYAFFYRKGWKKNKGLRVFMHRMIMSPIPPGLVVDHIDGNGMNNRKVNLRLVTPSMNRANIHEKFTNLSYVPTDEENEKERMEFLMKKDLAEIYKIANLMREDDVPEEKVLEYIKEEKAQRGLN